MRKVSKFRGAFAASVLFSEKGRNAIPGHTLAVNHVRFVIRLEKVLFSSCSFFPLSSFDALSPCYRTETEPCLFENACWQQAQVQTDKSRDATLSSGTFGSHFKAVRNDGAAGICR